VEDRCGNSAAKMREVLKLKVFHCAFYKTAQGHVYGRCSSETCGRYNFAWDVRNFLPAVGVVLGGIGTFRTSFSGHNLPFGVCRRTFTSMGDHHFNPASLFLSVQACQDDTYVRRRYARRLVQGGLCAFGFGIKSGRSHTRFCVRHSILVSPNLEGQPR